MGRTTPASSQRQEATLHDQPGSSLRRGVGLGGMVDQLHILPLTAPAKAYSVQLDGEVGLWEPAGPLLRGRR